MKSLFRNILKSRNTTSGILIFFFFHYVGFIQGQQENLNITLQGELIEQLQGSVKSIPEKEISFQGFGSITSNDSGKFNISLPAVNDDDKSKCILEVQLDLEGYKIVSPFNGLLIVDQSKSDAKATIVAMKKNDEGNNKYYKKQIFILNQKLNKLKSENNLSNNRINAINDSLLLSISIYNQQKIEMDTKLEQLNSELDQAASDNTALRQNLKNKIEDLRHAEEAEQELRTQLYTALEEKFLRQQKYYQSISADLKDYLIRAKDVLEQVQHVKEYFPQSNNPGYVTTYNNTLKKYNKILVKINEQHKDYIENVNHYWSSQKTADQVKETFNVIFEQLHYPKLQPALGEINGFIRVNKRKKAEQFGKDTFQELYPIVLNLEKSIDKTLTELNLNL